MNFAETTFPTALNDGSVILDDIKSDTTRFVLIINGQTKLPQLVVVQDKNVVTLNLSNLVFLAERLNELKANHTA